MCVTHFHNRILLDNEGRCMHEGCDYQFRPEPMTKRQKNALDKRIEQLYYKQCSGVQIDVMDIGKVFDTGRKAVTDNPSIDDAALGNVISDFVQTIARGTI